MEAVSFPRGNSLLAPGDAHPPPPTSTSAGPICQPDLRIYKLITQTIHISNANRLCTFQSALDVVGG